MKTTKQAFLSIIIIIIIIKIIIIIIINHHHLNIRVSQTNSMI
jgi:hypothetical protein